MGTEGWCSQSIHYGSEINPAFSISGDNWCDYDSLAVSDSPGRAGHRPRFHSRQYLYGDSCIIFIDQEGITHMIHIPVTNRFSIDDLIARCTSHSALWSSPIYNHSKLHIKMKSLTVETGIQIRTFNLDPNQVNHLRYIVTPSVRQQVSPALSICRYNHPTSFHNLSLFRSFRYFVAAAQEWHSVHANDSVMLI